MLELRQQSSGRVEVSHWGWGGAEGGVGQVVLQLVVQLVRKYHRPEIRCGVGCRNGAHRGGPFTPDWSVAVLAFVFSAFIGIIFGYFPARAAARMDPIEALRHQ